MKQNTNNIATHPCRIPPPKAPPVYIGQKLETKISSTGRRKDAVAFLNGFVIFIQDCNKPIGEKINIEITAVSATHARAIER